MILSFLIPTKNRPDDLEANILAISNLNLKSIDYEILVLDDGSIKDYTSVLSRYKFVSINTLLIWCISLSINFLFSME